MKSNLKSQNIKITWSEESKKCGDDNFSTNVIFLKNIGLDFLQIDTLQLSPPSLALPSCYFLFIVNNLSKI